MSTVLWQILVQFVLIGINAFFAASEIAVISLNEVKLRRQVEEGDTKAQKMLRMVEEPTGFLSTIQVGITLAGFLGSAFAADSFSELLVHWLTVDCNVNIPVAVLDTISVIFITIILSFFTLVLGELVPKRVAMRNPEKLARNVCGFILGLSKVLKPCVWLLSASTNGVLRLFGINPHESLEKASEEDIMDLVGAVEEQGEIDTDTREMIENVFEFDDISIADIMVRRSDMILLHETDTKETVLQTMAESGFSRIPVCGENTDDIKGIVLAREYLIAIQRNPELTLADMLQKVKFVPDSLPANRLFRDMRENKIHMVIVVDEYGQTVGLVTMENLLELIVGSIYDETDAPERPEIVKIAENEWNILGSTPIETVEELLGMPLRSEEDEYSSFGGFVFSNLGYVPQENEQPEFTYKNLSVSVESVVEKRIDLTHVIKSESAEEDADAESNAAFLDQSESLLSK